MNLDKLQVDKLTEVATIAFGNASTALSKLIEERVEITVPSFSVETVESASDRIGTANEMVTEILLKMSGDLNGVMLLLFDPEEAKSIEKFISKGESYPVWPEVGNILVGNALKAISNFLKINVLVSIPDVATDMRRALIVSSVFQLGEDTDTVLLLGTKMTIPRMNITAGVYFIFDELATHKIVDSI